MSIVCIVYVQCITYYVQCVKCYSKKYLTNIEHNNTMSHTHEYS